MNALWGLVFTALAAFIGLALLLSFDTTREWVGLGDVIPTGIPGWIYSLIHGPPTGETQATE